MVVYPYIVIVAYFRRSYDCVKIYTHDRMDQYLKLIFALFEKLMCDK